MQESPTNYSFSKQNFPCPFLPPLHKKFRQTLPTETPESAPSIYLVSCPSFKHSCASLEVTFSDLCVTLVHCGASGVAPPIHTLYFTTVFTLEVVLPSNVAVLLLM